MRGMFRAPDRIFSSVFLFFFLLSSQVSAAETRGYDDLLSALRAEQASPQDRVAASWKMGKLMEQDAEAHKLWADYSEEINKRLAQDLRLSVAEIRDLRQFARLYPEMPTPELGWAHYMILVYVQPAEKRKALQEQALREHWPSETLRLEVRKFREEQKKTFKTERAVSKPPAELNTYRVLKAVNGVHEGKLVLDLGFGLQKRLDENTQLTEGDAVRCTMPEAGSREAQKSEFESCILNPEASFSDFHTYHAAVTKIIDGDTFTASVDLGFGLSVKQLFRLKGVDAPELYTGEGATAKTFVFNEIMRSGGKIILRAGAPDKYNRILAEVWVGDESLNTKLVEAGMAMWVEE